MTPAPKEHSLQARRARREPVILFSISKVLFGIAAASIHEIRSTDSLSGTAVQLDPTPVAKVTHLFERGRKLFFVIHGSDHFGLRMTRPGIILMLRDAPVAVLADSIENMTEISELHPLPAAFQGEERNWYRGLAYLQDRVIPILDPGGFLTAGELEKLNAAARLATVDASAN
jgi:chemotaxis signal transduction protein